MCHSHKANNFNTQSAWRNVLGDSEAQEQTGGQGTPPIPCLPPFISSACRLLRGTGKKPAFRIPGVHASQKKVWGQGKVPSSRNMHYPLLVQLYNFQLSEGRGPGIIIQTPSRVNAKILSGYHLTPLATDVIPISLCTAKKNSGQTQSKKALSYLTAFTLFLWYWKSAYCRDI